MSAPTFAITIVGGAVAIRCLLCGSLSANANDVRHRYCGRCHLFHEAVAEARRLLDQGAGHECHEWTTALGVCAVCERTIEARV